MSDNTIPAFVRFVDDRPRKAGEVFTLAARPTRYFRGERFYTSRLDVATVRSFRVEGGSPDIRFMSLVDLVRSTKALSTASPKRGMWLELEAVRDIAEPIEVRLDGRAVGDSPKDIGGADVGRAVDIGVAMPAAVRESAMQLRRALLREVMSAKQRLEVLELLFGDDWCLRCGRDDCSQSCG